MAVCVDIAARKKRKEELLQRLTGSERCGEGDCTGLRRGCLCVCVSVLILCCEEGEELTNDCRDYQVINAVNITKR